MQKSRLLEGFRAVGLVTYPLEAAILKVRPVHLACVPLVVLERKCRAGFFSSE